MSRMCLSPDLDALSVIRVCVCVLCVGVSRGGECLILYVPYVGDGETEHKRIQ